MAGYKPPEWGCGIVIVPEMRELLAQPGYIKESQGGTRLRRLYQDGMLPYGLRKSLFA